MSAYTVSPGTQVNLEGRVYAAGEQLDAEPGTAEPWLAAGWVTEAPSAPAEPTVSPAGKSAT